MRWTVLFLGAMTWVAVMMNIVLPRVEGAPSINNKPAMAKFQIYPGSSPKCLHCGGFHPMDCKKLCDGLEDKYYACTDCSCLCKA